MNKNWIKNIYDKVFKLGEPLYLYIGLNILIFVLMSFIEVILYLSGNNVTSLKSFIGEYLAFPANISLALTHFYTIITYQFLHDGLFHLLFNMLTLYWLGTIFSDFLKPRQFHFVYITGGIFGALLYLLAYNIFPVFEGVSGNTVLIGASAAVMAIAAAAATLVPDLTLRMLLLGDVKLKYLIIGLVVLDVILIASRQPGTSFAHIGGAVAGFIYIRTLRSGTDLSSWLKKKKKLTVVKNETFKPKGPSAINQKEIDSILDKISQSGYENLTKEEKTTLFKASNN